MTRKEQISAEATDKYMYAFSPIPPEAKELFQTRHKAFCEGAEWADDSPLGIPVGETEARLVDDCVRYKEMLTIAIDRLKSVAFCLKKNSSHKFELEEDINETLEMLQIMGRWADDTKRTD